jgi:uncharacterized membrane protein
LSTCKKELTFLNNSNILLLVKKHAENIGFPDYGTSGALLAYAAVLTFSIFWLILIFAAPFLSQQGSRERMWAGLIRFFFAPACHQIEARSFICFHHPLAVCARCTGVYAGFIAGLLVYPFVKRVGSIVMPPLWILGSGLLPAIAEWLWTHASGSPSSNMLRSLSGGVAGAVAVFWVLPAVFQLVHLRGRRWKNRPAN